MHLEIYIVQYINFNLQEWYQPFKSLEADQAAKDQEVNQLKSNVEDLQSDLLAKNDRVEQLNIRLSTLQDEYDIKLKEMDDIQSKYDSVVEEHRELMEQRNVGEEDSEAFTQYSVPDSLEYDIKVRDTSVCICMYRPASNSASIIGRHSVHASILA